MPVQRVRQSQVRIESQKRRAWTTDERNRIDKHVAEALVAEIVMNSHSASHDEFRIGIAEKLVCESKSRGKVRVSRLPQLRALCSTAVD